MLDQDFRPRPAEVFRRSIIRAVVHGDDLVRILSARQTLFQKLSRPLREGITTEMPRGRRLSAIGRAGFTGRDPARVRPLAIALRYSIDRRNFSGLRKPFHSAIRARRRLTLAAHQVLCAPSYMPQHRRNAAEAQHEMLASFVEFARMMERRGREIPAYAGASAGYAAPESRQTTGRVALRAAPESSHDSPHFTYGECGTESIPHRSPGIQTRRPRAVRER